MPPTQDLGLREAFRNLKANAASTWPEVAGAFDGDVWPELAPGFRLRASDVIFTIGSCFVRNIETHLARLGCRTPVLDFVLPPGEFHGKSVTALNKFAPPSFRQAMAWTATIHDRGGGVTWDDCAPLAFDCGEAGFYDFDIAPAAPVARARFVQRRQQIHDIFRTAFSADCLIMTPGLIEAWMDTETGLYLQGAPTNRRVIAQGDRFRCQVLDHAQCLQDLTATIDIVRVRNPGVKVLVTTSPVPLSATFTGQDIRTANTHSKSVLRAACGALPALRPKVDYFPSYESVALSHPHGVWNPDRLHVSEGFTGKIVERMLGYYVEGADERARESQRAVAASAAGDWSRASASARRVLELDPDNLEAAVVLIDSQVAVDRDPEAEARLRRLCELYPQRPDLLRRLGRAVASQGKARRDEAADIFAAACAVDGGGEAEFAAADRLLRALPARAEDRERLARLGVTRSPLKARANRRLVDVLIETGREDEAIHLLGVSVDLPDCAFADQFQLAGLLAKRGRIDEARRHAYLAATLAPEQPDAAALLASLRRAELDQPG